MSLTLKDLRVSDLKHWVDLDGTPDGATPSLRFATLADLVEVLKQEGASIIEVCGIHEYHYNTGRDYDNCVMVEAVVLPLGDTL